MKCAKCDHSNPGDSRFCGNCGAPLVVAPTTPPTATTRHTKRKSSIDFLPGRHFGARYQIVEEIGRGGMGVVYKAIDRELDRIVALKMIRPELSSDRQMIEQFKRELILAREIGNDHVIRIHDLGEADGVKYISMKYIEGTSLKDLIHATGRLTLEKALSIAKQICTALSAAHRKGVVHRDLKPQNVMLDRSGDAIVMDFGIARSVTAMETMAQEGIVGTPDYISPEQARGAPGDPRSDIYSLGCIVFEMVTGRKPFVADTLEGKLNQHMTMAPPTPSSLNPRIPQSLDDLILKSMEKNPETRFESAEDLSDALEQVAKDLDGVGTTPTAMTAQKAATEASIAVLPFRDMSPEKDQEYFCDGMAEEIINALVKIESLRVAALTSAFQFRDKGLDVRAIGEQLNVASVLEGSVRKAGNRLRVTAQLVNVSDGYHVWSERYDRDMEDVFAIQDDISEAIVGTLAPKLGVRKSKPTVQRSQNLEAYNLYLKGRYHWNKRVPDAIRRAIDYFNQALKIDPNYAPAYAGLADCYIMLGHMAPKEIYAKARAAATRALELDDTLAEPHTTLAWVACNSDFDWDTAEREFRLSIEMNPNYATAHQWYSIVLTAMGRFEEAFQEMERAKEIDPLSLIIKAASGWVRCCARQYDRALKEAVGALDMDPDFMPAHSVLASIYLAKGMAEQAVKETRAMLHSLGLDEIGDAAEKAFSESGLKGALEVLVREFSSDAFPYPSVHGELASLWVKLEDHDKALAHLEQAYQDREQEFPLVAVKPDLDPLHSDPRFRDLLNRIGLKTS